MTGTTYFNWKGPQGRETVDELSRSDFPSGINGYREYRREVSRLIGEYSMAGMAVYSSSRHCKGWLD